MSLLKARALVFGAGVAAAVGLVLPADAREIAEVRGGVYYDADGRVLATQHVNPSEGDRMPSSFLQKYVELGIELPQRRSTLEPRFTREKPGTVLMHGGQIRNQIIVKFVEGREVRLRGGLLTEVGTPLSAVTPLLDTYAEASVQRAFTTSEEILAENKLVAESLSGKEMADLNNYYLITFPTAADEVVELANDLLALDVVEIAYFPAQAEEPGAECVDLSPTTSSYEGMQSYLDPAPVGVDADFAKAYHAAGGGNPSYWITDLEWGWCLDHEDLDIDATDVLNGNTGSARDHGTAVLGIYGACDNGFGVEGITPNVTMKMSDFDSEADVGVEHRDRVLVRARRRDHPARDPHPRSAHGPDLSLQLRRLRVRSRRVGRRLLRRDQDRDRGRCDRGRGGGKRIGRSRQRRLRWMVRPRQRFRSDHDRRRPARESRSVVLHELRCDRGPSRLRQQRRDHRLRLALGSTGLWPGLHERVQRHLERLPDRRGCRVGAAEHREPEVRDRPHPGRDADLSPKRRNAPGRTGGEQHRPDAEPGQRDQRDRARSRATHSGGAGTTRSSSGRRATRRRARP